MTHLAYIRYDVFGAPTAVRVTKAELARLCRLARSYGYQQMLPTQDGPKRSYACPMASVVRPGHQPPPERHRIPVWYSAREKPTAAVVDKFIVEHLTGEAYSDGSGRCCYIIQKEHC